MFSQTGGVVELVELLDLYFFINNFFFNFYQKSPLESFVVGVYDA